MERLRLAFQPVADRAGLAIERPRTNFLLIGGLGYLALIVIAFVVGLLLWNAGILNLD